MSRISSVDAFPVRTQGDVAYLGALPDGTPPPQGRYFRRPPWRSLYSSAFESLLVRLRTDDGAEGWGEALAPVAPQVPAAAVSLLLAPQLLGRDPRAVTALRRELSDLMRERGHLGGHQADALAAVDIALWDLKGRLLDEPVTSLLGGPHGDAVPAYVSGLPAQDDAERVDLARAWYDSGWSAFKLHMGHGLRVDVDAVAGVAELGPDVRVALDAHWGYSLADAKRLADALAEVGVWFLEAPLAPEDVDGHCQLRRHTTVPVAVGESLRHRYELRPFLESGGMDVWQPDVGRTGITEAWATIAMAEAHHIRVAPHHSTALGIALAAGLHVAAATNDLLAFEYQPTTFPLANSVLQAPLQAAGEQLTVPTGPGLGVDVDAAAVEEITIREDPP